MITLEHNANSNLGGQPSGRDIVSFEANHLVPLRGDFSAMARKRHQNPRPFKEGNFWWINPWQDHFEEGRLIRKRKRVRLCLAEEPYRVAFDRATEELGKMNSQTIGSATQFQHFITNVYRPVVLPLMAITTRASYEGTLEKYLLPKFGKILLRDLTTLTMQRYFTDLGTSDLNAPTVLKIKEVLSAVLGSAVTYEMITKNPMRAVKVPRNKHLNRKKQKPHVTPEEFETLVAFVDEPYSTMIYVAVFSGLRVSELIGLKWEDVHDDSITVDERYCRGDWSETKTKESSATIGVPTSVIARIRRLKNLEVEIRWGGKGARKRIKVVRSDGPKELVFQSLRSGAPMRDGNMLRRHLRPAALKLGIDPKKVTWQAMRRSYGTWMSESGANIKDVQGQMRHSRISTTMDTYVQHVPESQRRAVAKMMDMVESRQSQPVTVN